MMSSTTPGRVDARGACFRRASFAFRWSELAARACSSGPGPGWPGARASVVTGADQGARARPDSRCLAAHRPAAIVRLRRCRRRCRPAAVYRISDGGRYAAHPTRRTGLGRMSTAGPGEVDRPPPFPRARSTAARTSRQCPRRCGSRSPGRSMTAPAARSRPCHRPRAAGAAPAESRHPLRRPDTPAAWSSSSSRPVPRTSSPPRVQRPFGRPGPRSSGTGPSPCRWVLRPQAVRRREPDAGLARAGAGRSSHSSIQGRRMPQRRRRRVRAAAG